MITIDLNEITQTTGHNRSCPDIARKLIQEGADPSEKITFTRSGTQAHTVNSLAWWAKVQHVRLPRKS